MKKEKKVNKNYQWDINNPNGYKNRMGKYKTDFEIDFIDSHLKPEFHKIIDLGGGSGRFALPLIKKGFDVTLVDIDETAIKLAKAVGISNAHCQNLLEINEFNFDAALAIELLMVTNPHSIIKKANEIIKPNGLFIFVSANSNSWRFKIRKLKKKNNSHDLSYSRYLDLLKENGFEIIKTEGFMWMPFKVNSNNILIPLFAKIEKTLQLGKWKNQSPWIIIVAKKIK